MSKLFVRLAAFLALLSLAAADCHFYAGGITCCVNSGPVRKSGGLRIPTCRKCEGGTKLSRDRTQCIPDHQCPNGKGPGMKGIDPDGSCYKCADDNCDDCSNVYTSCVTCKFGYEMDEWNNCYNLKGMSGPDGGN